MYTIKRESLILFGLIVLLTGWFIGCPNGTTPEEPVKVESISYNDDQSIQTYVNTELDSSAGTPTLSPEGATGSFAVTSGTLPDGLSLDASTGKITGTPATTNGEGVEVTIQFTAAGNYTGTVTTSVTIVILPKIELIYIYYNGGESIDSYINTELDSSAGTPTLSPEGATGSFAITSGTLPDGLSLDASTGKITGTPTTPYPDGIAISIRFTGSGNYGGTAVTFVRFVILEKTLVTGISYNGGDPIDAYVNIELDSSAGTPTLSPAGASGKFEVTSGTLPAGLSLDATTGEITGTPTTTNGEGVQVTIQFTGSGDYAGVVTTDISIKVVPVPDTGIPVDKITYNGGESLIALKDVEFNDSSGLPTLSPSGATGTFSVLTGSLPDGLSLDVSTGRIAGTPTTFNRDGSRVTVKFIANGNYSGERTTEVVVKVLYPVESIAYSPSKDSFSFPQGPSRTQKSSVEPSGATGSYSFATGEGYTDPADFGEIFIDSESGAVQATRWSIRSEGVFRFRISFEGSGDYWGVVYTTIEIKTTLDVPISDSLAWKSDSSAFVCPSDAVFISLWMKNTENSFEVDSLLVAEKVGAQYGSVAWGEKTNRILAARNGVLGFDIWEEDTQGSWQLVDSFPEGEGGTNPYSVDDNRAIEAVAWSPDETVFIVDEFVPTSERLLRVWRWNKDENSFVVSQTLELEYSIDEADLLIAPDGKSFASGIGGKPRLFKWDEATKKYVEATHTMGEEINSASRFAWSRDLSAIATSRRVSNGGGYILTIWNRDDEDSFTKGHSGSVSHSAIQGLSFSSSSTRIALLDNFNYSIKVVGWDSGGDPPGWSSLGDSDIGTNASHSELSPDGNTLVVDIFNRPIQFISVE